MIKFNGLWSRTRLTVQPKSGRTLRSLSRTEATTEETVPRVQDDV